MRESPIVDSTVMVSDAPLNVMTFLFSCRYGKLVDNMRAQLSRNVVTAAGPFEDPAQDLII